MSAKDDLDEAPVREPIEEFPSMRDPKSFAVGVLTIVAVVAYCWLVQP